MSRQQEEKMNNKEKAVQVLSNTFGFKFSKKWIGDEMSLIDCEECPVQNECSLNDVCQLDEWWDRPYKKIQKK